MRWIPAYICLGVTAAVYVYVHNVARNIHEIARRDKRHGIVQR